MALLTVCRSTSWRGLDGQRSGGCLTKSAGVPGLYALVLETLAAPLDGMRLTEPIPN
jgi:hypothetical protein